MKRALAAARQYAGELITMAALIAAVVGMAGGGRIFRWEAYVWAAVLGLWIMTAGWRTHIIGNWMAIAATWERVCRDRRETIDRLLDELDEARQKR